MLSFELLLSQQYNEQTQLQLHEYQFFTLQELHQILGGFTL